MVHWDQFRYFLAVAQNGSVIGAARELGVSHATVLRQVGRLEEALGLRLFEHRRTGYRITPEGAELLTLAREMEASADALMRRAAGRDSSPSGPLRIGLPDPSLFDLLPTLRDFAAEHPAIRLVLAPAGERAGPPELDLTVQVTDQPPEALIGRQIARLDFRFQASREYLARFGSTPPAAEQHAWITWREAADGTAIPDWQRAALAGFTREARIVLEAGSHAEGVAAARAGFGVALLAAGVDPELVELPAPQLPRPRGVWLLTHPDLRRAGRVRAFMGFMAERLFAG